MSLKSMTTEQMLRISGRWLGEQRERLAKIEEARGALAMLGRVHPALEEAQSEEEGGEADELQRMTMKLGQLDLVHDRRVRGVYHVLTGLSEALDDEEAAHAFGALRGRLLPAGVNTTLMSYEDQAAEAARAQAALDAPARELLSSVALPDGSTLLSQVEGWLEVAAELGQLWVRRQEARVQAGASASGGVLRARRRWISAANLLRAGLRAAEIDEATRRELLDGLEGGARS